MVLQLFSDSLKCSLHCKYCVDSSICHFKFPKVVLAHVIGEVGTFCTVLLAVSSRTCVPIFIKIDSFLTNTEQEISWHSFSRHGVDIKTDTYWLTRTHKHTKIIHRSKISLKLSNSVQLSLNVAACIAYIGCGHTSLFLPYLWSLHYYVMLCV